MNRVRLDVLPESAPAGSTVTADIRSYRGRVVGFMVGIPALAAVGFGIGGLAESSLELGLVGAPLAALRPAVGIRCCHVLESRREKTREHWTSSSTG